MDDELKASKRDILYAIAGARPGTVPNVINELSDLYGYRSTKTNMYKHFRKLRELGYVTKEGRDAPDEHARFSLTPMARSEMIRIRKWENENGAYLFGSDDLPSQ